MRSAVALWPAVNCSMAGDAKPEHIQPVLLVVAEPVMRLQPERVLGMGGSGAQSIARIVRAGAWPPPGPASPGKRCWRGAVGHSSGAGPWPPPLWRSACGWSCTAPSWSRRGHGPFPSPSARSAGPPRAWPPASPGRPWSPPTPADASPSGRTHTGSEASARPGAGQRSAPHQGSCIGDRCDGLFDPRHPPYLPTPSHDNLVPREKDPRHRA